MKFNAVNNARSPSRIRATSDGFVERPEETRGCPRHVFDSILRALGPILLGVRMKDEREGESGENDIVKDFGGEGRVNMPRLRLIVRDKHIPVDSASSPSPPCGWVIKLSGRWPPSLA